MAILYIALITLGDSRWRPEFHNRVWITHSLGFRYGASMKLTEEEVVNSYRVIGQKMIKAV
jgi:hypothetical protein